VLSTTISRWPYLVAVALIAAAGSDLLVEAVANSGAFGRGYFDTDDSSIMPSLLAAVILAAGVIGGHMFSALDHARAGRRDWLANVAADVARHAPLRYVRHILALQFAALFAMESAEQYLAHGQLAGGLRWLGGPPPASIALHVSLGVICTLAAGWLMRASAPHFASFVRGALDLVLCARGFAGGASFVVRRAATAFHQAQAARAGRISGRAPPFFPLPV
jgi:hypothetical protein